MPWRERVSVASSRFASPRTARLASKYASNQFHLFRERAISDWEGRRDQALFTSVRTYAFFIGFPRSGHTLVGAMLNAHPEILLAHEVDALRLVQAGISRNGLFRALVRGDERFAARGWRWGDFDYAIPGQYQGQWTTLRVIGDKKGEGTTRALRDDPALLGRLQHLVEVPVAAIVVVRNPFDNIARMALKSKSPVLGSIWAYRQLVEVVETALAQLDDDASVVLRHEALVADPVEVLGQAAAFLGVPCTDDWAKSAASVVFESPRRTRDQVDWTAGERAVVEEMIERHPVLGGYEFES